jgi:phosphatidylserine synthase
MRISAICLIVYLAIIIWCDYQYGFLAQPMICAILMLVGLVIIFPGLRVLQTRKASSRMLVVFIVIVIAMYFISFSPVKSFKRLFYSIQPGMSRSTVQNLLANSFPANSKNYVVCFPLSPSDNEGDDMRCILLPYGTLNESIEVYYKNRIVEQVNLVVNE